MARIPDSTCQSPWGVRISVHSLPLVFGGASGMYSKRHGCRVMVAENSSSFDECEVVRMRHGLQPMSELAAPYGIYDHVLAYSSFATFTSPRCL